MTQINWALGQGGGFENALAQGFQVGSQIRQRREEGEQRNALAAYATNPTPEALNSLAPYNPEFVLSERARMQQAEQQQQQAGAQGIAQFRPVLEQVQANPNLWPQARAAAIQGGIDASRIPEAYDPNWVSGQLLFVQASEDGSLPGIVRELRAAGIDETTPDGQQTLRDVLEGKYGTEYTDEQGNIRRRRLFNLPRVGGQAQDVPPPPAGFVIDAPTMQNTPPPQMNADGHPSVISRQQYDVMVSESTPAAVDAYLARRGIQVRN